MIIFPATGGGGGPGPPGPAGVGARLTFDPAQATDAAIGRYQTFPALYTKYLTNPLVDICMANGGQIPAKPGGGNYLINKVTRLLSDAEGQITIDMLEGAAFEGECLYWENFRLCNRSSTVCLVPTGDYPYIGLGPKAWMARGYTTDVVPVIAAPCFIWTTEDGGVGKGVSLKLGEQAELNNNMFNPEPNAGPVFEANGTGPSPNAAQVYLEAGKRSVIPVDSYAGNANSNISINTIDGTASVSFDQPNYLGQNSPLDATAHPDLQFNTGLIVPGFTIANASGGGAPQWLQLVQSVNTTDATPTTVFPVQAPPPVISAGIDLRMTARDAATGDTATWIIKGFVHFGFVGAAFGPLGLVEDFYDADPGAAAWTWNFLLNSPDPNNVQLLVIGEAGKNIKWSISLVEMLVLAF